MDGFDRHSGLRYRKHVLSAPSGLSIYDLKNEVSWLRYSAIFKILRLPPTTHILSLGGGGEIPNWVEKYFRLLQLKYFQEAFENSESFIILVKGGGWVS